MWRLARSPKFIVYRDPRGTFTRSVTITFGLAVVIMFLVRGQTTQGRALLWRGRVHADHGDGAGHSPAYQTALHRSKRAPGACSGATVAAALAALVFVGQIVGKWKEGGWVVLISFCMLALLAHAAAALADGLPRPEADSSHRARQGARARRDGVHRRVAVAEDAGVSLSAAGRSSASLCVVRRAIGRCATRCPSSPAITITRCTPIIPKRRRSWMQYINDEPAEPKLGGAPNVTEQPSELEQQFPSAAKKDE